MSLDPLVAAAQAQDRGAFDAVVAPHLRALKTHCYRMSGSWTDAEDLLQESLARAWKGLASYRGASSVKTWLYAVTTRVCLDGRRARTLPMALGPHTPGHEPPGAPAEEIDWLEPMPGAPEDEPLGPEARLTVRQSVALAFLTVVQRLPPQQRAVLLLRDVLGFSAAECADLLETSVASVNSALQRARASTGVEPVAPPKVKDEREAALLGRYMQAWESADVALLVSLLGEGATLSMPPFTAWYSGVEAIAAQLRGMAMPPEAAGRRRVVLTQANALPAVAVWRLDPSTGKHAAEALHVVELTDDGKIASITAFMDPRVFQGFGLPAEL